MHPAIIIGTVRSLWTWLWGRYHVPQNVCLVIIIINASLSLPARRPAADDNSLIGCTSHDLTDEWSLPMPISLTVYACFAARLGAFFYRTRFI